MGRNFIDKIVLEMSMNRDISRFEAGLNPVEQKDNGCLLSVPIYALSWCYASYTLDEMDDDLIKKANEFLQSLRIKPTKDVEEEITDFEKNGKRHFYWGSIKYTINNYGEYRPGTVITVPKVKNIDLRNHFSPRKSDLKAEINIIPVFSTDKYTKLKEGKENYEWVKPNDYFMTK